MLLVLCSFLASVPVAEASTFIGLDNGKPLVHFGTLDPALPPVVVSNAAQLRVVSPTSSWTLSIEAMEDLIDSLQPGRVIPASRLAWAVHTDSAPQWTPLQAGSSQTVLADQPPTGGEGRLVGLDLRLSPSWEDPPSAGTYETDLRYTLSPGVDLNYSWVSPTPFCPDGTAVATIGYWLPGSDLQDVEVKITTVTGEGVRVLAKTQVAGKWETINWDGRNTSGEIVPPGTYNYEVVVLSASTTIAAGSIEVVAERYGGSGVITGRVTDVNSGEPLSGVNVVLYTTKRQRVAGITTSVTGSYRLAYLPADDYYLEVSLPGYITVTTDVFHLDPGQERRMDIELMHNHALFLQLAVFPEMVTVGDILLLTLKISNTGTRNLLTTMLTVQVPPGLHYLGGTVPAGELHFLARDSSFSQLIWETGSLGLRESLRVELRFVVGPDCPLTKNDFVASAVGYSEDVRVEAPPVRHPVRWENGPFVPSTPQDLLDIDLVTPVGDQTVVRVFARAEEAEKGPGVPFSSRTGQSLSVPSRVLPVSEPLVVSGGGNVSHKVRLRAEGSMWAAEIGRWEGRLLPQPGGTDDFSVTGIQGAIGNGFWRLRGLYGIPDGDRVTRVFPANNTAGPFCLSEHPVKPGSATVVIASRRPDTGKWQEEKPVLCNLDYRSGILFLAQPVAARGPGGEERFIMVSYTTLVEAKTSRWVELALELSDSLGRAGMVAHYWQSNRAGCQTGILGIQARGSCGKGLRLEGSIQSVVRAVRPDLVNPPAAGTDADPKKPTSSPVAALSGSFMTGRIRWQLGAALQLRPDLKVGGGYLWRGEEFPGQQYMTMSPGLGSCQVAETDELDSFLFQLEDKLTDPSLIPWDSRSDPDPNRGRVRQAFVLGTELSISPAWQLEVLGGKEQYGGEEVLLSLGERMVFAGQREANCWWETGLEYQATGLPHWWLGYGRRRHKRTYAEDRSAEVENEHYGILTVEGRQDRFVWKTQMRLGQSWLSISDVKKDNNPVWIETEFQASYNLEEGIRPYVGIRHHLPVTIPKNAVWESSRSYELEVGMDGQLNERLQLGISQKWDGAVADSVCKQGNGQRNDYADTRVSARYQLTDQWALRGSMHRKQARVDVAESQSPPPGRWEAGVGLEGRLFPGLSLFGEYERTLAVDANEREEPVNETAGPVDRLAIVLKYGEEQRGNRYLELAFRQHRAGKSLSSVEFEATANTPLGRLWEIWTHAAAKTSAWSPSGGSELVALKRVELPTRSQLQPDSKMPEQMQCGSQEVTTQQLVVRVSRRLGSRLAGFIQTGVFTESFNRYDVGYGLGLSYRLNSHVSLLAGYSWPVARNDYDEGRLTSRQGLFMQVYIR